MVQKTQRDIDIRIFILFYFCKKGQKRKRRVHKHGVGGGGGGGAGERQEWGHVLEEDEIDRFLRKSDTWCWTEPQKPKPKRPGPQHQSWQFRPTRHVLHGHHSERPKNLYLHINIWCFGYIKFTQIIIF